MLAPRLTTEPRVASLISSGEPLAKALRPGRKEGSQGLKDAAVERRKARPADRKAGRLLTETAGIPGAPYGALLPHLGSKKQALCKERTESRSFRERIKQNQD